MLQRISHWVKVKKLWFPFALLAELSQNSSCSSNPSYNIKNKVLKQPQVPFYLQSTAASPGFSHRLLFSFPYLMGSPMCSQLNCLPDGSEVASDTSTDCSGVAAHSSLHTHTNTCGDTFHSFHCDDTPKSVIKMCKNINNSVITGCKWYETISIVFFGGGSFKKNQTNLSSREETNVKNVSGAKKCFRSLAFSFITLTATHSSLIFVRHFRSLSTAAGTAGGGDSRGRGRDVTKHAAGGFGSCQASLPFSTVTEETHFTFYCFSMM